VVGFSAMPSTRRNQPFVRPEIGGLLLDVFAGVANASASSRSADCGTACMLQERSSTTRAETSDHHGKVVANMQPCWIESHRLLENQQKLVSKEPLPATAVVILRLCEVNFLMYECPCSCSCSFHAGSVGARRRVIILHSRNGAAGL
jgi:hypothetical protein